MVADEEDRRRREGEDGDELEERPAAGHAAFSPTTIVRLSQSLLLVAGSVAAAFSAATAVDAMGRHARLLGFRGPLPELPRRLERVLAIVPARAEGEAVVAAARDLLRERAAASRSRMDVVVVLDGGDAVAARALEGTGAELLVKTEPGPNKGAALAFAARALEARLDSYDVVLVFDADSRLPEGFLDALRVPSGAEAFQLPVRHEPPEDGAARVAAYSSARALCDDLARDARGLPVRLRGKAMGFTPRAFREGPARAWHTNVEDSEATLLLLARGYTIRALPEPAASERDAGDPSRSRARWLLGHVRLLATGARDIGRVFRRSPWGAVVLGLDLWLRPRTLVLSWVLALAATSTALLALSGPNPPALLLLVFTLSVVTILLEAHAHVLARRLLADTLPRLTPRDLLAAFALWMRAAARGLLAPGRWHRARPEPRTR